MICALGSGMSLTSYDLCIGVLIDPSNINNCSGLLSIPGDVMGKGKRRERS